MICQAPYLKHTESVTRQSLWLQLLLSFFEFLETFFFFFFTWPQVWIFILVSPITRMNIGNVRHCKWMMKLCVYLKVSNFTFLSVIHLLLWQLCACGLVRFWHKKHLGRLRKRSCFGLKYLVPGEVSTSKQLSSATNMAGTWSPHSL